MFLVFFFACRNQQCRNCGNINKRFVYIKIWYQSINRADKRCANETVCFLSQYQFDLNLLLSPVFFCYSSNHHVHLKTDANFTTGQRVYVSGKLQSTPVRSNDGKLLTATAVKANQLYVLNNESASVSTTSGDRNFVEVLGNVSSDITRKNDHCTFSLATHYNERNPEEGTPSDKTSFHRVFAYDSELCKYIENKLKKRDRILLTGKIGHMTNTGDDGKRVYSGFIIADSIYQIAQRSSSADVATNETAQLSSDSR